MSAKAKNLPPLEDYIELDSDTDDSDSDQSQMKVPCLDPNMVNANDIKEKKIQNEQEKDESMEEDNEQQNYQISVAEEKKNYGNEAYKTKKYALALQYYSEAILLCPVVPTYYSNRAACHMMLNNHRQAVQDARRAVTLDANFVKAWVRLLKSSVLIGDTACVEQCVQTIAKLDPKYNLKDDDLAMRRLREFDKKTAEYIGENNYRSCLFYLDYALKDAPSCIRYRLLRGECLAHLGRHDEAIGIAVDVMKVDATCADAIYLRGLCLYFSDSLEKGTMHFERALQLDPDHKRAREMRQKCKSLHTFRENGNAYFRNGRYRDALPMYTEALKIDANNKEVNSKIYYNRALVHSKIGNLRDSINDCTTVLQMNDKYLKALLLRARCNNDLEHFDKCVEDYELALQQSRTNEIKKLLREAKMALKRSKRKDYYKILGIDRSANDDEIKKAYRKKAMIHHPDKHSSSSNEKRLEEEVKFKEIGEAYNVLSDARQRARYDNGHDMDDMDQEMDASQMFRHFQFQFGGGSEAGGFKFEFK